MKHLQRRTLSQIWKCEASVCQVGAAFIVLNLLELNQEEMFVLFSQQQRGKFVKTFQVLVNRCHGSRLHFLKHVVIAEY